VCVALGIQHAMCMCHIAICGLPVPLYSIFPHYLINGTVLGKMLLNIKCEFLFSLQLLSETFFILRKNKQDMIKNVLVFM